MNRNIALDVLKLSLAFMVVGIHAEFLTDVTSLGYYLTVNGIFRIAVPMFLLISGFYFYTVMVKRKSTYWFKRILYLYLFWMLFCSYFWFRPLNVSIAEFANMIQTLVIGFWHLWYLPGMLGAAVLVLLFKKLSLKSMISIILITFVVGVAIQYIGNYHMVESQLLDQWFNTNWVHRNFLFFAFPLFTIGFLINKYNIQEKVSLKYSIILSTVGFTLLLGESYLNYVEPLREGGFDNYASFLVACPALFILFMNLDPKGKSKQLALYATGVYFIHPFFLLAYNKFTGYGETRLTFIVILLSIISTYFLIKVNDRVKFML